MRLIEVAFLVIKLINSTGKGDDEQSVVVQCGNSAHLLCILHDAENGSINWIRIRDSHLISVGAFIYIRDERFRVTKLESGKKWNLQIRNVQKADNGLYECQSSTQLRIFRLHCLEPTIKLLNGKELFAREGSKVTLKCRITEFIQKPAYVLWLKNGQSISNKTVRNREKKIKNLIYEVVFPGNSTFLSTLVLLDINANDTANYTCFPYRLVQVNIGLSVIDNDNTVAMHQKSLSRDYQVSNCMKLYSAKCFLKFLLLFVLNEII